MNYDDDPEENYRIIEITAYPEGQKRLLLVASGIKVAPAKQTQLVRRSLSSRVVDKY